MKSSCLSLPLVIGSLLCVVSATPSRADYVLPAIDFYTRGPSGIYRVDETTGLQLTAGNLHPGASTYGPYLPTDIAVGPDGNVYVSELSSASILAFDARTGQPLFSPHAMQPPGRFAGIEAPAGARFMSLTFGPDDRLYVLDANFTGAGEEEELKTGIRVYDSTTGLQVDTLLENSTETFIGPSSLAFNAAGNLYLSDRDNAAIYEIDVAADTMSLFASSAAANFSPTGMAFAPNGDLYVASVYNQTIVRFDSQGENDEIFATIGPDGLPNSPAGVEFDRDGSLLVAVMGHLQPATPQDTAAGRLLRYDLEGNLLETVIENLRPTPSVAIIDDLLPGDFNGDGYVDENDYDMWKTQFGSEVTPTRGADGNGDGVVDAADYTIWRNTLGATGLIQVAELNSAAVPEPSTLVLASLLGLLAFHRRALR